MAYELLERINSREDLCALPAGEIERLCAEIRAFLVEKVSRTGGHLASNLGIVETSVAIARCFDTARDRVIYDVGHQSYVHKILTGRRDQFDTLRTFGGLSGFLRPEESAHDPFITGHASNSVSAALGLARAARLRGEKIFTVAVIGDGALTGGLAYEALNDAGASGERILVILNDNGMSIDRNVGALSRYLARFRIRRRYLGAKRVYHRVMDHIPGGERLNRFLTRNKDRVKAMFVRGSFVEQMGFTYIGPVDGNNYFEMENALRAAREIEGPILLHAVTRKGLGYAPSEEKPEEYHGVSSFEPSIGCPAAGKRDFSAVFGEELCALAEKDGRVCAVTAAMPAGCGLIPFRERFPERFFDVGIAEEHAVTLSSGLAAGGMLPVFAVYSSFLQRGLDQLIHDVALMKTHVIFAVDRAGLVGRDGETHHGEFDLGYLLLVPGMRVYLPASFAELRSMLRLAAGESGPVALRYPRGGERGYSEDLSGEDLRKVRHGERVTLVSYGKMWGTAQKAAELLAEHGISASLWKLNRLPAENLSALREDALATGRLVFIEEIARPATAGAALAPALCGDFRLEILCAGEGIVPQGTEEELLALLGLTPERIAEHLEKELQ